MATCCTTKPRERIPLLLLPLFLALLALLAAATALVLAAGLVVFLALLVVDLFRPGKTRSSASVLAFLRRTFPSLREMLQGIAIFDSRTVCRIASRLYGISPLLAGLCYRHLNTAALAALAAAAVVLAGLLLARR